MNVTVAISTVTFEKTELKMEYFPVRVGHICIKRCHLLKEYRIKMHLPDFYF